MKRILIFLLCLFISGCVGASTFGMNQESYERNLLSLKDKNIDYEVRSVYWMGGPKEIGEKRAEFAKQNPLIIKQIEDIKNLKRFKLGDPQKVRNNLQKYFPEILTEIETFAQFYGMPADDLISFAGGHFAIGSCSIYMTSSPFPLMARNYDWTPTMDDSIISSYESMPGRYASIGMSGAFFGNLSGMNEKGLAIAITAILSEIGFPDNGGISMPVIIRGVLDKAADVQSAIDLLTHVPHTTPCNYALIDKTGSMAVVEVSVNNIKVRKKSSVNYLTATNHFQAFSNETEKVRVLPNSIRRQKSIETFHDKNPSADVDSIFNFFGDTVNGPAMSNYSILLGTIRTIVYLPRQNKMIFRVGLDGEKKTFAVNEKWEGTLRGVLKDRPPKASDYFWECKSNCVNGFNLR